MHGRNAGTKHQAADRDPDQAVFLARSNKNSEYLMVRLKIQAKK